MSSQFFSRVYFNYSSFGFEVGGPFVSVAINFFKFGIILIPPGLILSNVINKNNKEITGFLITSRNSVYLATGN